MIAELHTVLNKNVADLVESLHGSFPFGSACKKLLSVPRNYGILNAEGLKELCRRIGVLVVKIESLVNGNTFKTKLVCEGGKYYVTPYGAKIEVTGDKAKMLADKKIGSRDIILGVRPEHITLSDKNDPAAIACTIQVNEMMGSELHLHVVVDGGDKLIVRIPTVSLTDEERARLVYGEKMYITFEGKVMHFFNPETEQNILA
jgi:hypothetical protein